MPRSFRGYTILASQTFLVTGGAGVLCSEMASALFALGANVAILDRNLEMATAAIERFPKGGAGRAIAIETDVLQTEVYTAGC